MTPPRHQPIPDQLNATAREVVDCAFAVHRTLGPGLLENVYERCLAAELSHRGVAYATQVRLPVVYRDLTIDAGYRLDLLVEDNLVVEVKAVEQMLPIHEAQLLTYLKLANKRLGLLVNFNVPAIKNGIRRLVL